MNSFASDHTPRQRAIALFGAGLLLPILGGGNVLFSLEPELAVRYLALVVLGLVWVFTSADRGKPSDPPAISLAALLVLLLWWCGTLLLRPSGPRAFLEAQGLFYGALLYATFASRPIAKVELGSWITGLAAGTLITAVYGQYQYWAMFPTLGPLLQAAALTPRLYVNANFYTANCYAPFVAAVLLLFAAMPGLQAARMLVAAVLFMVLLLTESRSTLALFLAAAIALNWSCFPHLRRRTLAPAIVLTVIAVSLLVLTKVNLDELWRVGWLGRVAIWEGSVRMIRAHWLWGVGLGRFWDYFEHYRIDTYYTRYPHSFLLEVFAELGIVGGVAMTVWLAVSCQRAIRQWSCLGTADATATAIVLAIGMLVAHASFDIDWHAPANPMLLCALLGIGQHLDRLAARDAGVE